MTDVLLVDGSKSTGSTASFLGELPHVNSFVNAATGSPAYACSPGGAAALTGILLTNGSSEAPRVEANGEPARVLTASATRVVFVCPEAPVGSELTVLLRNSAGASNIVRTIVQEFTPGVFTIDGSAENFGTIVLRDRADLTIGTQSIGGRPAKPGEVISIFSTGLGRTFGSSDRLATTPVITVHGITADILTAARIDEGVFRIDARLPDKVATGKQLPLQIELVQMNGDVVHANTVYIDIEAAQEVH